MAYQNHGGGRVLVTKREDQPFRFSDLPAELRVIIYKFILVKSGGWKLGRLIRRRRNPKPTQFLLVSKWINKEASRILYRDNLFQFRGVEAWSDCYLFLRSTGLNKSNITKLDLDFSSFGNGNKHLTGIRMACIKLCKLPSLKTLQFGIGQDIMTREMLTLRKLKFDQLRGKVVLVAKEISYYYRYEFFKRPVRVRSEFIAVIGSWGWKFEGAFEPIELGHNHKFNDEGKWLADVRNEQKRNARTKRRMQYPL